MRFTSIILLAFVAVSSASLFISEEEYAYQFAKFQVAHNKTYSRAEYGHRYNVFKKNYDLISEHNSQGKSWILAVNEFADLSFDEFRAAKLGYKPVTVEGIPRETVNLAGVVTAADNVDWRTKNVVTPVKNQGSCGSCWAFSTTGSIEGAVAIKTGKLTSVSEQQLVDCSTAEGNQGCNGGLMDDAFKYVISNKGICTEASYPYTGADGTCQTCTQVSQISKYVDVTASDLDALKAAASQQPISVAVEADQLGWQFYFGGVMDGSCGTALDHGVLVAGYGTDATTGKDYWLVKNSWGATWGEAGYIRLVRTSGKGAGQCGIAMQPSYPIAA